MTGWLWFGLAFLCGSLPLSLWLGRLRLKQDIRQVGDGNPGATNVLRAGGWKLGALALILDITKSALPVGLAYQIFGLYGFEMVLVAWGPSLGHSFSPLLRGRGGKALATMLGAWIGLSWFELPAVILILLVFFFWLIESDGWPVLLTALGAMGYLLIFHPDPLWVGVLLGQTLLVVWKHRQGLSQRPRRRRKQAQ